MTALGRLADHISSSVSLRPRGERNKRRLLGLHPPADLLMLLVGLTDYELGVCLRARRLGYRLVFTPEAVVDHYPAHRPMGDAPGDARPQDVHDAAHNRLLVLLSTARGPRQVALVLGYELLFGRREAPAPVSFLALLAGGVPVGEASRRLHSAISGRAEALRPYLRSRRPKRTSGGTAMSEPQP